MNPIHSAQRLGTSESLGWVNCSELQQITALFLSPSLPVCLCFLYFFGFMKGVLLFLISFLFLFFFLPLTHFRSDKLSIFVHHQSILHTSSPIRTEFESSRTSSLIRTITSCTSLSDVLSRDRRRRSSSGSRGDSNTPETARLLRLPAGSRPCGKGWHVAYFPPTCIGYSDASTLRIIIGMLFMNMDEFILVYLRERK